MEDTSSSSTGIEIISLFQHGVNCRKKTKIADNFIASPTIYSALEQEQDGILAFTTYFKTETIGCWFSKTKMWEKKTIIDEKNEKRSEYGMVKKHDSVWVKENISMKLSLGKINILEQKLHDVSHIDT